MKKNKKWIIASIIIILVIIIALISLIIFGISQKGNFSFLEKTAVLYENSFRKIEKIAVDVSSYDVEIKESDIDNITVQITGSKKNQDKIKVEQQNDELKIYQDGSIICIGLCLYKEVITIYVPNNYELEYNHESTSGSLSSEVLINTGNIKTTSGDILLNSINSGFLKSTSGNIEITSATSLEVSSTSGDIDIKNIENLTGSTKSGNIKVNNLTNKINYVATSGDIKINKFSINEDSSLSATSGNIDIGLEKDIFINASTKSGDIDISNTNNNPTLTITTTSGDITAR